MSRVFYLGLIAVTCALATLASANPWFLELSRIKGAPVHYAEYSILKEFPVPVVSWRRAGLAGSESELEKIKTRVVYPIINESNKAVAAIVVEFNASDKQSIGVVVIWADGETTEALISKNAKSEYDANAYKVVFAKPVP